MTVTAYGQAYPCARAEKGPDYVHLYDEAGCCIASFSGISSFDGYAIEGGAWSAPPKTDVELLREQIAQQQEAIDALIIAKLEG